MYTDSSTSSSNSNSIGVRVNTIERRMRIKNPFTLKVGQVFTGFVIGYYKKATVETSMLAPLKSLMLTFVNNN